MYWGYRMKMSKAFFSSDWNLSNTETREERSSMVAGSFNYFDFNHFDEARITVSFKQGLV